MNVRKNIFKEMVNQVISNKLFRGIAVKQLHKYLFNSISEIKSQQFYEEKMDQYYFSIAIVDQAKKNLDRGNIKPKVVKKMVKVFVGDQYSPDRRKKCNPVKESYKEKYGDYPPQFLVLSPGKSCNLQCTGCYASADSLVGESLDFETVRRITREARDILGNHFMTISGGEPFLYKSGGKSILDLCAEFDDMFFLVYTNGTTITRELAGRLAELGNISPAISIEGWQEQTDQRRGKGVYQRILKSMDILKETGIPFGISITTNRQSAEVLLKDDFYEYFFNEIGISYMWQFQMMPIGRGKEIMEMQVTPEQRVRLFNQWAHLLRDKKFPVADFWNSGSLSNGCIAYGRWSGYFYIDWNGNIMPCVFVPYYIDNIKDLYANDKTLADALQSKMFRNGRKWQKDYGFDNPNFRGNILMPCSMRDHYANFRKNILTPDAKGENTEADIALQDNTYKEMMEEFDDRLEVLTKGVFREKYVLKEFNSSE